MPIVPMAGQWDQGTFLNSRTSGIRLGRLTQHGSNICEGERRERAISMDGARGLLNVLLLFAGHQSFAKHNGKNRLAGLCHNQGCGTGMVHRGIAGQVFDQLKHGKILLLGFHHNIQLRGDLAGQTQKGVQVIRVDKIVVVAGLVRALGTGDMNLGRQATALPGLKNRRQQSCRSSPSLLQAKW